MSLMFGSGGGGLMFGGGGGSGQGSPVNTAELERTGRRSLLLERYAPELANSGADGAAGLLALAESQHDDDEMLRMASEAVGYANINRLREDMEDESDEVAAAQWAALPRWIQDGMREDGFEPPGSRSTSAPGGRLFGSIPILGDVTEAALDWGEVPLVGGALEEAQHFGGEALETSRIGNVADKALTGLQWIGELPGHLYRLEQFGRLEGPQSVLQGTAGGGLMNIGYGSPGHRGPSGIAHAWRTTDNDPATGESGYVRPAYRERALEAVGGDRLAFRLAGYMRDRLTPDEIVREEGLTQGTPEAAALLTQLQTLGNDAGFNKAIRQLDIGRVSPGRSLAESVGLPSDRGLGRIVSGLGDAGFRIFADPTLVGGKLTAAQRFGRHAFRLETADDAARGFRYADIALDTHRARVGRDVGQLTGPLGHVTARDARRGRDVLNWADHVAGRVREGAWGPLSRELPNTSTALGSMADWNARRLALGEEGMDSVTGVLSWLQSRDGLLAVAGSRLGGGSPLARGLRIPALTTRDRAALTAKGYMSKAIDWSRTQYAPAMREITAELGNPRGLAHQLGTWGVAHTVGDAGRVLAGLSAHTPYQDAVRLFGDEAIPEFSRLVNTGIFTGMDRPTMDAFIDAFAQGDVVTRSNQVEQFLSELFIRAGIADTPFAERFVGRHAQAYGTAGSDMINTADGFQSHAGRLVDSHHASAVSIPNVRDFLRESHRVNVTRTIFHNAPSSMVDAALGRYWKPSVLMRLGFIPRAAGEELMHFVLKHGPRSYMGAKGAEWEVQAVARHNLEADLTEAQALGQVDRVNRLTQDLARTRAGLGAPMRSMAAAIDQGFTAMFLPQAKDYQGWRRRLIEKQHALDERGVVSGLEWFADRLALRGAGAMEWAASKAHVPSKAEVGRFMAERWNPNAATAARLMLDDPTVARAFAEQVAGSTQAPWELRRTLDREGIPLGKYDVEELSGGQRVMRELDLRPAPGEYGEHRLTGAGQDSDSYFNALHARHRLIREDRAGNQVLSTVLPRWTGGSVAGLPDQLGYDDITGVRADLNTAWAHGAIEGADDIDSPGLLQALREYVDDPSEFTPERKTWMGARLKTLFEESETNLSAGRLLRAIDDGDNSLRHWVTYENVLPERLTDDWGQLERQARHAARGRMSRPDMWRNLREMRRYREDRMAVPVVNGISKVYVPTVPVEGAMGVSLGDEFINAATSRIRRVGGYSDASARAIATNVAGNVSLTDGAASGGMRALSGWGSSDPRVAEAVMAAYEQTYGLRPTFGILEVPDEAVMVANNPVLAMGLRTQADNWKVADDYTIEGWRLQHVRSTDETRRLVRLDVDDEWWDDVELDGSISAFETDLPGHTRVYSGNRRDWSDAAPDSAFWFVDVPDDLYASVGANLTDDLVTELGARRVPAGVSSGEWRQRITDRQVSEGLPEIEALERMSEGTVDEVLEMLTTRDRADLDNDVLHELVEPLLRSDRTLTDAAGNSDFRPGYTWAHLTGAKVDRLPLETYGPRMVASRDFKWDRIVRTWFSGPVDQAISSIIRKPMFLTNFGEQLANSKGLADMFVDDAVRTAAREAGAAAGLDDEALDGFALNYRREPNVAGLIGDMAEGDVELTPDQIKALDLFARQRIHGLDLVRNNAMNRAMQLTIPFIDDHRIRSAFQSYVGNFIPFQFAEEQFLKRWTRSVIESPEMIRKGQLAMNGFRSMGVVRTDEQGHEVFVYPMAGPAAEAISHLVPPMFGFQARVPYAIEMTGETGYTLPGLGEQFGQPSVGPLVAMPLEFLSRHFPELAEVEETVVGRGADQPLWRYFIPSGGAKIWEAAMGDIDQGQLASATQQAIQTMAINGQAPGENATPAEQQEFIDRAQDQARFILMARAIFGMNAPAAPQVRFEGEELEEEFHGLLSAMPFEDAITAYLAGHPDADPASLLAATVSGSETEFSGLDMPTDAAGRWLEENEELVSAFPAAATWLTPRADADDRFSFRAYNQQFAKGLRRRKAPEEFLNDIYFATAGRDYFDARTLHEADVLVTMGQERRDLRDEWDAWRAAYFQQHPIFARMLQDPSYTQRRHQAVDQMTTLSALEDGPVPTEMRELVQRYDEYRMSTAGLRGDGREGVRLRRKELTEEFASWAEWQVQRHPHLAGFYLGVIEPLLVGLDEDAALPAA